MNADPGFQSLFNHLIGEMAKTIADRPDQDPAQRAARVSAAVRVILAMLPRDAIEAILAGHCVMFHELMLDSMRQVFGRETGARPAGVAALHKSFLASLRTLREYQARPAEGRRDETAEEPKAEEEPAKLAPSDPKRQAGGTTATASAERRASRPTVTASPDSPLEQRLAAFIDQAAVARAAADPPRLDA